MPDWLLTVGRFAGEWLQKVIAVWPSSVGVGKLIAAIVVVLAASPFTERVLLVPKDADPSGVAVMSAPLGAVIIGAAILCGIVLAFGMTWVGFLSLKVSETVEQDKNDYRLTVTNAGFVEAKVEVRLEEAADVNGPLDSVNAQLPLRLLWLGHGEEMPSLAKGLPYKVGLISVGGEHRESGGVTKITVGANGAKVVGLDLGVLATHAKNKLWFRITIGGPERTIWFSVQAVGPESTALSVIRESPLHLTRLKTG